MNMSSKQHFVGISPTGMKKHVVFDQKELKRLVLMAKGSTTTSLPFLSDNSQDTVV